MTNFNELEQYYFDRDDFCKTFMEVFSYNETLEIEVTFWDNTIHGDFHLFRDDDEYYILHMPSGILINWYKHLGRTNTCNKEGFTLEDLKIFFKMLHKDFFEDSSNDL